MKLSRIQPKTHAFCSARTGANPGKPVQIRGPKANRQDPVVMTFTKVSIKVLTMPSVAAEMRSKLCIDAFGFACGTAEVYMIMAKSLRALAISPFRKKRSTNNVPFCVVVIRRQWKRNAQGCWLAQRGLAGARLMSNLPTNRETGFAVVQYITNGLSNSIGKMATVVPPAIQMANSAMMKCAQFLDKMATLAPGAKFSSLFK